MAHVGRRKYVVLTVVAIGDLFGALGFIERHLRDRPKVRLIPHLRDYGPPIPYIFTSHVGLFLEIEVHSTGQQPVQLREIGIEIGRERVALTNTSEPLPAVVRTPGWIDADMPLEDVRRHVRTGAVSAFYVVAAPNRILRWRLRDEWRRFPHELSPADPGRSNAPFIAMVRR